DPAERGRSRQPEPTRGERYPGLIGQPGRADDPPQRTPRAREDISEDDDQLTAFAERVLDCIDGILARADGTIADNEDLRALRAEAEQYTGTTTESRRSRRTADVVLRETCPLPTKSTKSTKKQRRPASRPLTEGAPPAPNDSKGWAEQLLK